jgi:hypothetical protein
MILPWFLIPWNPVYIGPIWGHVSTLGLITLNCNFPTLANRCLFFYLLPRVVCRTRWIGMTSMLPVFKGEMAFRVFMYTIQDWGWIRIDSHGLKQFSSVTILTIYSQLFRTANRQIDIQGVDCVYYLLNVQIFRFVGLNAQSNWAPWTISPLSIYW